MSFDKVVLRIAELISARNAEKTIWEGMEPPVVIYRRELDLEIEIKEIEFAKGAVRIVI